MIHVEAKKLQEHDQGIDPETLEKYMAKVAEKSVKLLEEHTKLINELYEHGLADFNDAVHLQHINKRLSRKIRLACHSKPAAFVQQAIDLAARDREAAKARP